MGSRAGGRFSFLEAGSRLLKMMMLAMCSVQLENLYNSIWLSPMVKKKNCKYQAREGTQNVRAQHRGADFGRHERCAFYSLLCYSV
jgi:hypothetical protein